MGVPPAADPARVLRPSSMGTWLVSAGIAVLLLAGAGTVLLTQRGGGALPGHGASSGGSVVAQILPAGPPAGARQPVYHTVSYELTGGMGALNVTYVVQGSAIEQARSVGTPWSKSFVRLSTQGADYLTVSAQNAGAGRFGCRIVVDGAVVSERAATGLNGVVMCAKSIT